MPAADEGVRIFNGKVMEFKLPKFCIFCGKPPSSKNMEHPLPKWLLKLTGDLHRTEQVYPGHSRPLSTFEFPSCETCNDKWGKVLETRASLVMKMLLHEEAVSDLQITILMDWFDKVRIGLWLASLQLSNNRYGVKPKFHISSRVGLHDRFLAIYRLEEKCETLDWYAVDTFNFHCMPSCFSMKVNDLYFLNVSYEYLFLEKFGFPFPEKTLIDPNKDGYGVIFSHGKERIDNKLLKLPIHDGCSKLFQCMYPIQARSKDPIIKGLFDTDYVKGMSRSFERGISRVLVQKYSPPVRYPIHESKRWLPPSEIKESLHKDCLNKQTLNIQNWLIAHDNSKLEKAENVSEYFDK